MLNVDDKGRVRVITFARPEALNAFNQELYRRAAAALDEAAADDGVAVVVLTGAGRAFSAGQDLFEMAALQQPSEPGAQREAAGFPGFVRSISTFPKPLLAAVNGIGLGIGFTMLSYCDLVLISSDARLKTPFTSLGVAPEAASSYMFPLRMGWQKAAWVLFSSEWVSASEAVSLGIAWRECAPGALLDETMEVASTLAALPIESLMATKTLMLDAYAAGIQRARHLEDQAFARLLGGPANTEALQAFAEKRPPRFT